MTHDPRLGPPPVEPLSDLSWSRVERGLWARMDAEGVSAPAPRPPRRWWVLAAPFVATAAAAAVVVGLHIRTKEPGEEPARVVSGAAPSSVSFGDSHLELDANTALAMRHESGHPTVLLERGATWFTVAPRADRPAFIVRAGDATVRVVGTRFRVARSDERISVEVDHGLVDVQFRGRIAAVGAQQRWSSEAPGKASAIAAETAQIEPAPAPEQPAETSEEHSQDADVAAPSPTPPAPVKTARPREPKLDANTAADASKAASDAERAEYDRLAKLEPRSPEAALAGYLALARGTSRWADPALFAAARLAVDLHDRRAQTLLGIYLQRFPSGANATDAKQLLARIKGDAP